MTPTMRKLHLLMGILCLSALPVAADTVLNGYITKDSILEVEKSPYLITSNLTVSAGCILTIPADVVLKVSDNVSIDVWGLLDAEGATIKSVNTVASPGDWGNLRIGNYVDSAKAILVNCRLESFNAVYVRNKGSIEAANTQFVNSYQHGVYLESGGKLTMTGGSVETTSGNAKNSAYGVLTNNQTQAILTNVTVQGYQSGLRLNGGSQTTLDGGTVTACGYPIVFNNTASLTTTGSLSLINNDNDVAYIDFQDQYSDWNLPYLPIPYFFRYFDVKEGYRMTIASGNVLKFYDGGSRLTINGSLKAIANPGEAIYFTSFKDDNLGGDSNNDATASAPAAENWPGIRFGDTSVDSLSLLRRCVISYAGYDNIGGINTFNASPTIDSCDISNNYIGVYMEGLSNPVLKHSEIASSTLTPIAMSFEANPVMENNVLSQSDNRYDAIGIIPGTLLGNAHLTVRSMTSQPNMTYYLMGDVTIPFGKTLTIDKGITIKSFNEDWRNRHLLVYGSLIADATADSLITFTSVRDDREGATPNNDCNNDGTNSYPVTGDWGGIIFLPGSTGLMDYCKVKYANINGHNFSSCDQTIWIDKTAVAIIDANPTISNSEFKDVNHAIFCYRAADPVLENLSMVNVLYTPINLSSTSDPVITGITHTNVGWNALGLIGGPVCLNGTLKQRNVAGINNITYILLSDLTINSGSKIQVDPGVVVKFTDGNYNYSGRNIYVDGGFRVNGTAQAPVVFTSVRDDNVAYEANGDGNATMPVAGDWGAIKFRSTAIDTFNVLDHVVVKYGGSTQEGCLTYENAAGLLKNATVTNSKYYGLYFNGNAAPIIDGVSILNSQLDPIALSLTSNPTFSNMEFISNNSKAIKIIEGNLASDAVLAPRSMAGIDNIAYIVERLEINSGAKLTILPGVVVKFRTEDYPYISYIKSRGNLIAKGTPDNKIYFTSYKDDSRGGDSNNNGNTDAPQPGDWGQYFWNDVNGGIMFVNNTEVSDSVNVLSNCEISYPTLGVRVDNAHATIDSCTIKLCGRFGLASFGSANPTVKNTNFSNIGYTPIELSLFSEPTFDNCMASNVGYMAMTVVPETFSKSDTIPVRSFAGFDNINYLMGYPCTINSGCTITVPAGVTFKSIHGIPSSKPYQGSGDWANGFVVNGRLNVQGTAANPVVFTNAYDDTYGSPADMNMDGRATVPPAAVSNGLSGTWLTFTDISSDSSRVDHAIFNYGKFGISMQSASPVVNATRFEQLHLGIDMSGVSQPVIDSCVFHNLGFMPMQISLVAYPRSTVANTISGSTYKVIKVRNETLTQNVILPKRDFGGKVNIPYLFGEYTIGTSATLTIKPGVICKFKNYYDSYNYDGWYASSGSITVSNGLIAEGGSSPDSVIVFTSLFDDFYGGDSNSDGQGRTPSANGDNGWQGLKFLNTSDDLECRLNNCIIRYAINGVQATSAKPIISNTLFNRNGNGVLAEAASNPELIACDFSENAGYAIKNADEAFTIQALNSWWGSNDGPLVNNTSTNHTNDQEFVTTGVAYDPYRTIGIQNPLTGDVSLNGYIQAYAASLVLKHNVSLITLNDTQQTTGDVSGDNTLSAYDASLILQYVVEINNYFPINRIAPRRAPMAPEGISLSVASCTVTDEGPLTLKVSGASLSGLAGSNVRFRFDPTLMEAVRLVNNQPSMSMEYRIDNTAGLIELAMASAKALSSGSDLVSLTFNVKANTPAVTEVLVDRFVANEVDMTSLASAGTVTINRVATGLSETEAKEAGMDPLTPNPFKGEANLVYRVKGSAQPVRIEVFNAAGNSMAVLVDKTHDAGTYTVRISDKELPLQAGVYVIRMKSGNSTYTQKIQVGQ